MATNKLRFGLWYDFRNPIAWRQPFDKLYSDIFDQIVWGEQNGFEDIWLSEHHFIDDGYSPSLLPIAGAIAARTKTIRIGAAVILMPFHNPVRMAEDVATVDVISGGRFELGVGTGYKVEEFDGFGLSSKNKGGMTNEGLEIMSRLWAGETLTFKGKYYEVNNAKLTPEPIQKPRPPLWIGGFTPPALRRAAKYGDGFVAPGLQRNAYDSFVNELQKRGRNADSVKIASGYFWLIPSNDPEKTWNEAADHVLYQVNAYSAWGEKAGMSILPQVRDKAHLKELGLLNVVDVDTCIRMIREMATAVPLTHYFSWTLPPGLPTSWIQPHLELFAKKVIPAFR
jgi:alkanesulfonate monooxygenase SsuD/methylene tetrahydromethanopterin reductase-like flavin-dependent oxidoreductase (luciferase family)